MSALDPLITWHLQNDKDQDYERLFKCSNNKNLDILHSWYGVTVHVNDI